MELDSADEQGSGHGFSLVSLFIVLAIAIFVILITRFIYKVVKQKRSENNI